MWTPNKLSSGEPYGFVRDHHRPNASTAAAKDRTRLRIVERLLAELPAKFLGGRAGPSRCALKLARLRLKDLLSE